VRGARVLWTVGGLGLVPFAPGTAGTLAGVALAALASTFDRAEIIVLGLACVLSVAGVPLANAAERTHGKDPRSFVWDEVTGYLVTMLGMPIRQQPWLCVVGGFFVFRIFDILKPWPIRSIEAKPGGVAVMADDIVAGLYSSATMHGILWALPYL
jgi:phosphatidylglycerophosphatase A